MRIVLFDWNLGGHHARYLRHCSIALGKFAQVTVAAPGASLDQLSDLPITACSLGAGRPAVNWNEPLGPQNRDLAQAELDLLEQTADRLRPDHIFNLYGDQTIRWIVQRRPMKVPLSICVFFTRDHYPGAYASPLPPKELLRAWFQRWLLARWKRRSDAHALFLLDGNAVDRHRVRSGAGVYWLPEPPITPLASSLKPESRSGATVYGALAARKGIDLIAKAVTTHSVECKITLAGALDPQFAPELEGYVVEMRHAGASVDLRPRFHDELSGLSVLSESRCAVLAYPRHFGMSRVLLEACSVGTPVIAHDFGLLGHLVRTCDLGVAVDCRDTRALASALERFCQDPDVSNSYGDNLRRFADKFATPMFEAALSAPFIGTSEGQKFIRNAVLAQ